MVFGRRLKGAYGNEEVQSGSISDRYPDEIEPDDVVREIGRFAEQTHPIIVFDEFDRITDQSTKRVMSHTIKALSDTGITATIVLVGVADDINSLVEEHASVTRNISEIKMPRMSTDELNLILSNRYVKVGMAIDGDARWKIVALSRGLPEFVHSLGRSAALHAIGEKRLKITESDVDAGILQILAQSDQSANAAYKQAIDSNRKEALYRQVLLACAITKTDDEGKFAPKDVVQPLSDILADGNSGDCDGVADDIGWALLALNLEASIFLPYQHFEQRASRSRRYHRRCARNFKLSRLTRELRPIRKKNGGIAASVFSFVNRPKPYPSRPAACASRV